ncbi:MAG: anti-sigma factor [Rhizobiaceae bacterium]
MSDEDDRLERAGSYVLGLLDGAERERAERDLEADPAFREAVTRLAEKMHPLDRYAPEEPVSPGAWDAIAARIADTPQLPSGEPFIGLASGARPARPKASPSAAAWRGMAMAASLLAAVGLGYVAGLVTRPDEKPVVIVVLNTSEEVPGAIFEAFADNTVRIVPLVDFQVPADRTLQAWTLYDPAVGPVSLGTFPRAEEIRLHRDGLPVPAPDQLYEITLEPSPGSPTGKPTGPILVKGFAKRPAGT